VPKKPPPPIFHVICTAMVPRTPDEMAGWARHRCAFVIQLRGRRRKLPSFHGDEASEGPSCRVVGAQAWPGQRTGSMEQSMNTVPVAALAASTGAFNRRRCIFPSRSSHRHRAGTTNLRGQICARMQDAAGSRSPLTIEIELERLHCRRERALDPKNSLRIHTTVTQARVRWAGTRPLHGQHDGPDRRNRWASTTSPTSYADDLPYWYLVRTRPAAGRALYAGRQRHAVCHAPAASTPATSSHLSQGQLLTPSMKKRSRSAQDALQSGSIAACRPPRAHSGRLQSASSTT